jgi:SAM-dependent methyltransferase
MRNEKFIPLIKGAIFHLPGVKSLFKKSTGGSDNSRYCYSVWLRHLVKLNQFCNLKENFPSVIAELGPGDSLGVGLAALLSGCKKYYGLDVIKYWDIERNLKIFDELVELFRKRASIPDNHAFPSVRPVLENFDFPDHILTDEMLKDSLADERIALIRKEIANIEIRKNKYVFYKIPWFSTAVIENQSVDLIISQSVLGYVTNLEKTYRSMNQWLKPGGHMSHTIDFKSHGITKHWNSYWTYSELEWNLVQGGRPFLLNRVPASQHMRYHDQFGQRVIESATVKSKNTITRDQLDEKYADLSTDDLETSGIFVLSEKIRS